MQNCLKPPLLNIHIDNYAERLIKVGNHIYNCKSEGFNMATEKELINEVRRLRSELQQLRDIVNSLVSIIIEVEDVDEEEFGLLPDSLDMMMPNT